MASILNRETTAATRMPVMGVEPQELLDAIDALPLDDQPEARLLIWTIGLKDEVLTAGMEALVLRAKANAEENDFEPDYDLLRRMRAVCPNGEAMDWGRALVVSLMRGDGRRAATIEALMRRRVAN